VGGGVQLGPLGTEDTNRPNVPAPADYDDGEIGGIMIGSTNPTCCPDANPGRRGGKPATKRLNYGTALQRPYRESNPRTSGLWHRASTNYATACPVTCIIQYTPYFLKYQFNFICTFTFNFLRDYFVLIFSK
jgi:hypothetical protein